MSETPSPPTKEKKRPGRKPKDPKNHQKICATLGYKTGQGSAASSFTKRQGKRTKRPKNPKPEPQDETPADIVELGTDLDGSIQTFEDGLVKIKGTLKKIETIGITPYNQDQFVLLLRDIDRKVELQFKQVEELKAAFNLWKHSGSEYLQDTFRANFDIAHGETEPALFKD